MFHLHPRFLPAPAPASPTGEMLKSGGKPPNPVIENHTEISNSKHPSRTELAGKNHLFGRNI